MTRDGRQRVAIERVRPEIDHGRFPIKRTVGEDVVVEVDAFADGHDVITVLLRYRQEAIQQWTEAPMEFLGNDRWRASFQVTKIGRWQYTIIGWIDHFATWRRDLVKKTEAGQDIQVDLLIGAKFIDEASGRATTEDRRTLAKWGKDLCSEDIPEANRIRMALSKDVETLMARYPDRRFASTYDRELTIVVDREKTRFSAWYEMFPRSWSLKPGQHGTFKDCEARLPYIASMGFHVLYLPPSQPNGLTHR